MSDGNGRIPIIGGHRPAMKKDSDLITVREARALVAEEATKVHEYYLNQIPPFVARMIQDALMSYGLIKLTDEALAAAPIPTPDATASDATPLGAAEQSEGHTAPDAVGDAPPPPESVA